MDPLAPFLVTASGSNGLTYEQTRSAVMHAPSRGVRIPAQARGDQRTLDKAALLAGGHERVLVDISAARWWSLPLPAHLALGDPVAASVACRPGRSRPRRRGVKGRRRDLPDDHLIQVEEGAITSPARTWLDCAEVIDLPHVVAQGDVILRRQLASESDLKRMVVWGVGRRGVRSARTALSLLDAGAESPGESMCRAHLLLAGIPAPECNVNIFDDGQWLARADMAWLEKKVIVEYDGLVHLDEARRRSDAVRRNLLQDAGWIVIVATARDLRDPTQLIGFVRAALR